MQPKIFYIHCVKSVLCRTGEHFPQARNNTAGKDIFLNPWIAGMLL